jgi:hypothetical protein
MVSRLFSTLVFAASVMLGMSFPRAFQSKIPPERFKVECPAMSNVAVIPAEKGQTPISLNVRSEPGGTSPILGTFTEKDGVQRVVASRTMPDGRNFLNLKDGSLGIPTGGWIIARYLIILCDENTPTPTNTPTPRPTPTRIFHNFIYCKRGSVTVTPVANMDLVECESP